jgi:hypothetical protein
MSVQIPYAYLLLIRLAALVIASILGVGTGWLAGGALAPTIAHFVGAPSQSERPRPQAPPAIEAARQDGRPEGREKPALEPQPPAEGAGTEKKEEISLEERLKREALNEVNKRIEQAKREIEKQVGLGEKEKRKAERKKNGQGTGRN